MKDCKFYKYEDTLKKYNNIYHFSRYNRIYNNNYTIESYLKSSQ